ncbi:hypothetical protein NBRC116583_30320 [Arenicella sp. 4NH20-0111]|uniref:NF038104 family lipoprotein n=1 Tax=Arenicella sp. 4NH20-0111 TaxID=3127648 RepID=UPI003109D371
MQMTVKLVVVACLCLTLSGCLGTVVGAAVDTTIEVVKIPFKVVGAAVDVVTGDDLSQQEQKSDFDVNESSLVLHGESEGIH